MEFRKQVGRWKWIQKSGEIDGNTNTFYFTEESRDAGYGKIIKNGDLRKSSEIEGEERYISY